MICNIFKAGNARMHAALQVFPYSFIGSTASSFLASSAGNDSYVQGPMAEAMRHEWAVMQHQQQA